jgi:hypothetical protein
MEDTQEKARRNLVVFCSVVLFCAWLGLDELQLIKRVFGGEYLSSQTSASRAVLVALVVLIYLTLRYRFTVSFQKFLNSVEGVWSSRVSDETKNFLNSHLKSVARKNATSKVFSENIRNSIRTAYGMSSNVFDDENFELTLSVTNTGFKNPFEGTTNLTVEAKNPTTLQEFASTGGVSYAFKVHGFNRIYVSVKTFVKLVVYSEISVENLVPMAMASLSFVLLVARLVALNY